MTDIYRMPGAIDLHTHLREPSSNTSETIKSGTYAAQIGGFVLAADMPNNPGMPVWTEERLDAKIAIAEESANIPVAFYAGSQPEADNVGQLARMAPKAIGLKLYGDPTTGNINSYEADDFGEIVREWHRVAPDKPIMFHSGEHNLVDMINLVAAENQHPLHICHVNDTRQVSEVSSAKADELEVTCGVCPHHLLKTSYDVHTQGVFAEMKPPLIHQDESEAIMRLLESGDIDVVETDFAPHSFDAKIEAEQNEGHCYGVPGIEHVIPLLLYQVRRGRLSIDRLEQAISARPAEILQVRLSDDTFVDWHNIDKPYRIGEDEVVAQCGWSPYMGMLAVGEAEVTIRGVSLAEDQKLDNYFIKSHGTV